MGITESSQTIATWAVLVLLGLLFTPVDIVLRGRVKDIEKALASVTDFKHTRQVSATIAVVGCTPDRTQSVI